MEYKIMTILNEIKSLIEGKISNHWMNIDEVTNYSSLSHSTIRRAIKKGELKASRATGRYLFRPMWVDNYLERK